MFPPQNKFNLHASKVADVGKFSYELAGDGEDYFVD